ncbi:MAG: hypothetical protein ABTQ34_02785 [Bdellovibrionales bacterium]
METNNLHPIYVQFRQAASAVTQANKTHAGIRDFANRLNASISELNAHLNTRSAESYRALEEKTKNLSGIDGELAQALLANLPADVLKNVLFAFPLAAKLYQAVTQEYAQTDLPSCLSNLGGAGHREEAALIGYIKAKHVEPIYVLRQAKAKDLADRSSLAQLLESEEPQAYREKMGEHHLDHFARDKKPDDAARLAEFIKKDESGELAKQCADIIPADAFLAHRQGKKLRDLLLDKLPEQPRDKFMAKLAVHHIIRFAVFGNREEIGRARELRERMGTGNDDWTEVNQRIATALNPRHRPARANRLPETPLWRKPEL